MPVVPTETGYTPVGRNVYVVSLFDGGYTITPTTARYYAQLPEAYQDRLDEPARWPLRQYISLIGDQMHDVLEVKAVQAEATLSSFADAAYEALPWLTGITGVLLPAVPTATHRRVLPQSRSRHAVGSVAWITERIQTHLTGTKYCNLVAHDRTARALQFGAFGFDAAETGWDTPGFGWDGGPTPTPGVWQIRVEVLPSEAPADLAVQIQPYCPAGFRFIVQDVTSLTFAFDDALVGFDDVGFKLDA